MEQIVEIGGHRSGLASTTRTDRWWVEPLITGSGFALFVLYTTWAMLQGNHYWYAGEPAAAGFGGYLSPFYSPVLFANAGAGVAPAHHAWLGPWPSWWPGWLPASPALLILIFPLSFRLTCYYYRKFYYRAYFLSPPACAVAGLPQQYRGETRLLLIQNLHRYTMYIALAFVVILSYDAVQGFFRGGELGIGVGSVVLLINPTLLAAYTFGCHSFRHLIGGRVNSHGCGKVAKLRHGAWKKCSKLNARHQRWAWMSLVWVAWTDIYVRLVSSGVITDYSTWS